jgi:hypothetical protein
LSPKKKTLTLLRDCLQEAIHAGLGFIISLEAFNGAARGDKRPLQAYFIFEVLAGLYSILVGTALLNDQTFECFLRANPTTCDSVQFILGSILIIVSVGELSAAAVVFLAWLNVRGAGAGDKYGPVAPLLPERTARMEGMGASRTHLRVPISEQQGYALHSAAAGEVH